MKTGLITDRGIKHLTRLTTLRLLKLWRTKVTSAGEAELTETLPDCVVSLKF